MLDIEQIRKAPEEIERKLQFREEGITLGEVLDLDRKRRDLLEEVESLRHERNQSSKKIGKLKQESEKEKASRLIERMEEVSERIDQLEDELDSVETELRDKMAVLPNIPHDSVPISHDEEDKEVLFEYRERPSFDFKPKNHLEIGDQLNLFKMNKASKIAGSRFPFYYGDGALLEMGLIHFMYFFQVQENGYNPVFPPYLARESSYFTSGQLPKFEEDLYRIDDRGEGGETLYLNPTSESIVVNYYKDEIIEEDQLPKKFVAFTTCFRREAGSYGEQERGLIRTHQFNKVELFRFVRPRNSYDHFEELVSDAEDVLQELNLHYRKVLLPTGDMAQQSSKTVDLEVWLPAQREYYEVSSISNCEGFQARRGNIRYRPENGNCETSQKKPRYLHTLNGSGLATSRLLVALLENNQTVDGRVKVPEKLTSFLGKEEL